MSRCIIYGPEDRPPDTRVVVGYIYIMYDVSDPLIKWLRTQLARWLFSTSANRNQPACRIVVVYARAGANAMAERLALKSALRTAFPDHPWQHCWLDLDSEEAVTA